MTKEVTQNILTKTKEILQLQISAIPSQRFGDTQPLCEAIPLLERLTKIL